DLDLAVEGILWSAYGTTGQRCTACSRVIVHSAVRNDLLEKLVPRIEQLRLGNGLDEAVDVGPIINASQLEKIHSYTEIGKAEGATLVTGGEIAREGELARGHFYRPTLFTNRSEEHTSELQSPCKLVCRLLLEKKNLLLTSRD